ncbi:MAG: exo-alpha-sialidase [Bacteroidota bacterium]
MKIRPSFIVLLMISICAPTVYAQTDMASEIRFQPENFLKDSLPNLGLSTVKGAETFVLYDVQNNRPEYNQPYLGTYSHHGHLVAFKGIIVAMWSNHYGDEDSPGQYIRFSISKDGGKTWQNPDPSQAYGTLFGAVLFPPMEVPIRNPQPRDREGNKVSNTTNPLLGYRPHDNCGSGRQDGDKSYENDNCGHYHLEMCANGFAIVEDRLFALAEVSKGINDIGIGRAVREIKEDGTLGHIFWLNEDIPDFKEITPNAINVDQYDNKMINPSLVAKIIDYLKDPLHMPQWDFYHAGWVQKDGKAAKDWKAIDGTTSLHEPTYAYIIREGVYARLWRSNAKKLYAQYSYDRGNSWTDIESTSFTDSNSRTYAGNLPDGRSYIINNVNPGGRNPLVLSISADGKLFDTAYVIRSGDPGPKDPLGRAKDTGFQYPHSVISGDYMLVIYSINKESVAISRLHVKGL